MHFTLNNDLSHLIRAIDDSCYPSPMVLVRINKVLSCFIVRLGILTKSMLTELTLV